MKPGFHMRNYSNFCVITNHVPCSKITSLVVACVLCNSICITVETEVMTISDNETFERIFELFFLTMVVVKVLFLSDLNFFASSLSTVTQLISLNTERLAKISYFNSRFPLNNKGSSACPACHSPGQ